MFYDNLIEARNKKESKDTTTNASDDCGNSQQEE